MTTYVLLIPDDYAAWAAKTPAERDAVYAMHTRFEERLAQGGHRVTGGAELLDPATARTVRLGPDRAAVVTDGPYAEAVEQLSGFYLIESDDLPDLEDCCALLVDHAPVEIRGTGSAVEEVAS